MEAARKPPEDERGISHSGGDNVFPIRPEYGPETRQHIEGGHDGTIAYYRPGWGITKLENAVYGLVVVNGSGEVSLDKLERLADQVRPDRPIILFDKYDEEFATRKQFDEFLAELREEGFFNMYDKMSHEARAGRLAGRAHLWNKIRANELDRQWTGSQQTG